MASEASVISGWMEKSNDQHFLLLFIFGTYFGPDLLDENPRKSVLQRRAECLPPYSCDQLARSHLYTIEVEHVYYHVLRNTDQSLIMKRTSLREFFKGNLSIPVQDQQWLFTDLFPTNLHCQSKYRNRKTIENIVLIENPEISWMKPEYIERFKNLARLEDLHLDRNHALHLNLQDVQITEELPPHAFSHSSRKRKQAKHLDPRVYDPSPIRYVPYSGSSTPPPYNHVESERTRADEQTKPEEKIEPVMLFLPAHPTAQEWENIVFASKSGIGLTGTAAKRQPGPIVGLVDIGECKDAYLFRVSLPGVKNNAREFSCEVKSDGAVVLRGITSTGESKVRSCLLVFQMQSQNLCPSGPFSVSFKLPGPVEPSEFSGSFGTNGIFEAVLMKKSTAL